MMVTTRARGDTSGRMKRETPQAPSGMQPRSRTRCNVPMAPKSTVPPMPTSPKAGEAGAVVPTPTDCQPEKKWCQLVDHDGSGASWPTRGRVPKKSSRVPITTTRSAMTRATARWRPVPSGARADPAAEAVPPGPPAQVVELVEVGVLAEGRPDAPGQDGHRGHPLALLSCSGRSRVAATALAASRPWWESRLT